jgi:hypothetical protein
MLVAASSAMKSASSFLLAARQCEISELEQLAHSAELVGVIGRCVHALQRERGICNIFLSSQGTRFADQRQQQVAACENAEREVRAHLDRLDTDPQRVRNGSRLFSRVAAALHALDGLPALRARVAARSLSARESTAAYVHLVAGLLAVVFEAADSATDPQVSRALVALFNFMQGKEFAGQERAHGAGVFASGAAEPAAQQEWRHLIETQQACLQVFCEFADPAIARAQQAGAEPELIAQLERLRRIGATAQAPLDPHLSQEWYEACTRRIDAMRVVEDLQAMHLRRLCERRIAQAREELRDHRVLLEALAAHGSSATATVLGPQLERSVLALLQEQSRRLQAMGDELDAARASLNERKLVERAKGLLMAHRNMREDEAYKALRQMAMNQNRRLVDVAEAVLALADVLPGVR